MNMFKGLLGNLVDKEQVTTDTIQAALENVAQELQCKHKDFFIMIQPKDDQMNFKCFIYKLENGAPKPVREITVKEIVNPDDE